MLFVVLLYGCGASIIRVVFQHYATAANIMQPPPQSNEMSDIAK
jgi:hypothetical protein